MKSIKVEFPDRIEYQNEQGYCHRTDGPAIEWNNGSKEWFINGNLHREDGPAIEWNNKKNTYCLYNKEYSFDDWKEEVTNLKLKRLVNL
jgi:hypothetical protein